MHVVRVAHFINRDGSFVVVPFTDTYGYHSPAERQEILSHLTACIDAMKRGRMEGTVMIAWLKNQDVEYTTPAQFSGVVPKLDWLQLMSKLNRWIHSDDPVLLAQLAPADDYQRYSAENLTNARMC